METARIKLDEFKFGITSDIAGDLGFLEMYMCKAHHGDSRESILGRMCERLRHLLPSTLKTKLAEKAVVRQHLRNINIPQTRMNGIS